MSIIIPANSAVSGGYNVDNSLLLDRASGAKITNTFGSTTNRKTFTVSLWTKKTNTTQEQNLVFAGDVQGSNPFFDFRFNSDQTVNWYQSDSSGSGAEFNLITNRKFTDLNAWYHIVMAVDTTQGTSSNRVKLYVNGVQQTSLSTATYPSQNFDTAFNLINFESQYGGLRTSTPTYDGYICEVVLIDGQQLDPTSFGEFDEDSGVWKPISVSGLTFGDNGYYLDFEDSSDLGQDVSGNNNDFTLTNIAATDQSTDSCTNNFATFNPLFPTAGTSAFSEGNLKLVASGSAGSGLSSFGLSKGKWYMEVKQTAVNEPLGNGESGICVVGDPTGNLGNVEGTAFAYGIRNHNGTKFANTSGSTSWHGNWTAGDIISIALDMDNNNVYFAKNGQYANGSGSWNQAFTGSPAAIALSTAKTDYFLAMSQLHSSATETYELNFGSPPYAVSSGNADADGYGNFEYAVPSGYYSLNTKNLSEYG